MIDFWIFIFFRWFYNSEIPISLIAAIREIGISLLWNHILVRNFFDHVTKNYVTLDSGGVGRATDYLHLRKHQVGDARSHQNGLRAPLELYFRIFSIWYNIFCKFYHFEPPTYENPLMCFKSYLKEKIALSPKLWPIWFGNLAPNCDFPLQMSIHL